MSDYIPIGYTNNFLNQVIMRIDFLQFVPTENVFNDNITKEILRIFPRREKDQIIRFNSFRAAFNVNDGSPVSNVLEGIQKTCVSNDGQNKLSLSNKYMIFLINNYCGFEEHMRWFQSILFPFFQINNIESSRVGIRYINIFDSSKIRLRKNFFTPEISASLYTKIPENDNELKLTRSLHTTEYSVDDMILKFRYGMYNPEYPNALRKNDFTLDYDFFTEDMIDSADGILRVVNKGHEEIQALFEQSITDSLREVMRNG